MKAVVKLEPSYTLSLDKAELAIMFNILGKVQMARYSHITITQEEYDFAGEIVKELNRAEVQQ